MTALHRVKAYFGMVPADELDAYDGYDERDDDRYADRYDDRRRAADRYPSRYDDRYADRYDDRRPDERREPRRHEGDRYESDRYESDRYDGERRSAPVAASRLDRTDAEGGAHAPRPRDARDVDVPESRREESEVETSRPSRGRSWATNTGPNHTSVRPTTVSGSRPTPSLTPLGSSPSGGPSSVAGAATRGALAVDEAHQDSRSSQPTPVATAKQEAKPEPKPEPEHAAPAEITSLQPTSYNEARVIGERYRDGIPVIMNLTDMDEVAAKRLVDFAAGLAFALRGSIEKVTSRVFLLSPPNVEVSAAERRKLAENSYTVPS